MTQRKKQTIRIVVTVLIVIVAIPVVVAVIIGVYSSMRTRATVAEYREITERNQQRTYVRPADPPGWQLEPGESAGLYEQIWNDCTEDALCNTKATNDHLRATLKMLAGESYEGAVAALETGPPEALAAECIAAGVPEEPLDPALAMMSAEACQALLDMRPALDLMRQASRRENNRSPVNIWDPWSYQPDIQESRDFVPWMILVKLMLIDDHIAYLHGDRQQRLDGITTALRAGSDLGNGHAAMGALVGALIRYITFPRLDHLISSGELTPSEMRQLADELAYVRRQPLSVELAFEGEYLVLMDVILNDRGIDSPAVSQQFPKGLNQRVYRLLWLGPIRSAWNDILANRERPYAERCQAWRAVGHDIARNLEPSAPIQAPMASDFRLTMCDAHLAMERLALLDAARLAEGHPPAADAMALAALEPGLDVIDPLTDEPFVLTLDGDRRIWSSRCADPVFRAERGLDDPDLDKTIERWHQLEVPTPAASVTPASAE